MAPEVVVTETMHDESYDNKVKYFPLKKYFILLVLYTIFLIFLYNFMLLSSLFPDSKLELENKYGYQHAVNMFVFSFEVFFIPLAIGS